MVFAVALTGDIGAGKSTLLSLWASMGASVASADRVVEKLWITHEILRSKAKERWGRDLFDDAGKLRKDLLCARVFGDSREYRYLCETIHPMVEKVLEEAYRNSRGWFVAEIPLLFERGIPWWADTTVYVTSHREERLKRNLERGKTPEWLEMMESKLLPPEKRSSLAGILLENSTSRENFNEAGMLLGERFLSMSSVVEMQCSCSSLEEAERIRDILESRNLGIFFSLARHGLEKEEKEEVLLSWLSLERHFTCVRKLLPAKKTKDNEDCLRNLRAFFPRRMELEVLEKIVEVCG